MHSELCWEKIVLFCGYVSVTARGEYLWLLIEMLMWHAGHKD